MTMFAVDADTGDRVREGGAFTRVTGETEIAQHVRVRLRLFRNEIPLNLRLGMDYFGLVLVKGTSLEEIEGEFRSQILDTPGMVSVDQLTFDQTDAQVAERELDIDFNGTISVDDLAARIPVHDRFTIPAAFSGAPT